MKQIRDYKKQCTGIYFSFFLLLLQFWGAWSWWEINCSAKLTSFRRGVYVIDSKILELRILSKDLFPTLLYCSAMKATISVPYIHVCHAVLSTSCASALSKNTCTRQSHGENATKRGDRINPVLNIYAQSIAVFNHTLCCWKLLVYTFVFRRSLLFFW